MDADLLEYRLALVERQIADDERHITLPGDIVARLDIDGLGASEQAGIARDLLHLPSGSGFKLNCAAN